AAGQWIDRLLVGDKAVHVDIAVGAIDGALTAANAPIFDDNFLAANSANGADRTTDEAIRVKTRPAGAGHEIFVETQAFANQASYAVVRVGAGLGAFVTAGALLQIKHQ